LKITEHRKKLRDFTADHIVPIALGGEEFDLKNIQLLCEVCDKAKTARDAAMIARRRKEIKRVGGTTQLKLFNMSDLQNKKEII
jgi:5-methylcytosine-specific restriction endonuclease McrA